MPENLDSLKSEEDVPGIIELKNFFSLPKFVLKYVFVIDW